MEALNIQPTDETPGVIFDPGNAEFKIWGKSLPEDVTQFYDPVLQWIDGYQANPNPTTELVVNMVYFNTASSKLILDILIKFEEINEAGKPVNVVWYYEEDDEDMEEAGD
ncbi:MAG: DUF1987 domain-containing protein, partial [Bacteroidota bacterium]